jgi:hypothetical protein
MRPSASWLGAVLVVVSAVGCNDEPPSETIVRVGGGGGGGGGGGARASNLDIEGFWATYANEMDATVVSLHANGNAITGRGCLSGWPESTANDAFDQCGEITGTVEGSQVSFQFYFAGPDRWNTYGVSVQPLPSGARMNGEHYYYQAQSPTPTPGATKANLWKGPATLFRAPLRPADEPNWPFQPLPQEVTSALAAMRWVTLLGDAPAGKFTPGTSYELETMWGGLQGDLGVFAPVDVTYEYPETGVLKIHAGPVAQPDPDAPISLEIEVRDERAVSIEAGLATGEVASFAPLR